MKKTLILSTILLSMISISAFAADDIYTDEYGTLEKIELGFYNKWIYTPDGITSPSPVVVVLHGCGHNAVTMAQITEWNNLAYRYKFRVLYPEKLNNEITGKTTCFNYFLGENETDNSEMTTIMGMINDIKIRSNVDPDKIYITGFSAGAAMSVALAGNHPDYFAGVAPMDGGAYGIDTGPSGSVNNFYCYWANICYANEAKNEPTNSFCELAKASCAESGLERCAQTDDEGKLIQVSQGIDLTCNNGDCPPIMAVYGGRESNFVCPANSIMIKEQWLQANGLDKDMLPSNICAGGECYLNDSTNHTYEEYKKDGETVVALLKVKDMTHAISVDPGTGYDEGGSLTVDFFNIPINNSNSHNGRIYSTYYIAKFFNLIY